MNAFTKQLQSVAGVMDGSFTKDNLTTRYWGLTKKFLAKYADMLIAEGADTALIILATTAKTLPKEPLTKICALPFASKKIYEVFLRFLPEEVEKVWQLLIWEDQLDDVELEKRLGVKVYSIKQEKTYYNRVVDKKIILPQFNLFYDERINRSYGYYPSAANLNLGLPPMMRQLLASYYDLPDYAKLSPVANPEPTQHTYTSGERDILLEWPRVLSYKQQGQIGYTAKNRPTHTGLPKMNRNLSLQEFFPDAADKKMRTLRTGLLAGLAVYCNNTKNAADTPQILQDLFEKKYPTLIPSAPLVLPDLKGMANVENYDLTNHKELQIRNLLAALPAGGWVPFDNIGHFVRFNLIDIRPMANYQITNKLYYDYSDLDPEARYYDTRHFITPPQFGLAIDMPFLRGSFFLFAAFGLCDLAYDEPDLKSLGRGSYSSWDGLRYVRRTKLGDFVCGIADVYDSSGIASDTQITLSPDTLLIMTDSADASAAAILEPYTERLGANRFRTDSQVFLKNIRSKKELEGKIALFKQIIGEKLPPNWQAFFQDLLHKINPFEEVAEPRVLQIPADNKALIQLIAQDAVLKSLVIKAEGYMIIIPKGNYAAVKRRLQEFGYLLT